jgi:CheY-like chemotaxis protein
MSRTNLKVMVVEDSEIDMTAVVEALISDGIDYVPVSCSADAMRIAIAEQPDVALLDMNMAPLNGRELYKALQENPATKHIKCMFLTASSNKDDVLFAVYMHIPYYLKGVPIKVLLDGLKGIDLAKRMIPKIEQVSSYHRQLIQKYSQPVLVH